MRLNATNTSTDVAPRRESGYGKRAAGVRRLLVPLITALVVTACGESPAEIPYSELKQRVAAGEIAEVEVGATAVDAVPTEAARSAGAPAAWRAAAVPNDPELVALLDHHGVTYTGGAPAGASPLVLLPLILMGGLIVGTILFLQRRAARNPSGLGDMRVQDATRGVLDVNFGHVAGADEAKEELEEVVAFLKDPDRFARLGARVPRGVLLVGPPGTGKTLLARAVAGEAGVPFFSISGSEFVEMFVGVGASRVRKLFQRARSRAPCIVFIDELDAAGKARGGAVAGANDEREQTLNQLLVEMDGFGADTGIVVLAATNRPEILDAALLRPGRFDRQVLVDRPDRIGREAILRVHARRIRLDPSVDLTAVAARTPGFVGADLANLLNEAALLAARAGRASVGHADLDAAIDRVTAGLEKKNRVLSARERTIVAYHEAGHAIVAEATPTAEPVARISIVPRGLGALGYMQQIPEERFLLQEDELRDRLAVLLGGRAAEAVAFGKVSTGAGNDLERATELARRMVCEFGMSETVGPVSFKRGPAAFLDARGAADPPDADGATRREIDREVRRLVADALERARALVAERRAALDAVAHRLLDREVVDRDEFLGILRAER